VRVVLDVELDRLGLLLAGDLTGEPQAEVDAGRDAGRGGDLAGVHDPFPAPRLGAHGSPGCTIQCVVAGSPSRMPAAARITVAENSVELAQRPLLN